MWPSVEAGHSTSTHDADLGSGGLNGGHKYTDQVLQVAEARNADALPLQEKYFCEIQRSENRIQSRTTLQGRLNKGPFLVITMMPEFDWEDWDSQERNHLRTAGALDDIQPNHFPDTSHTWGNLLGDTSQFRCRAPYRFSREIQRHLISWNLSIISWHSPIIRFDETFQRSASVDGVPRQS
jgi:hypothetical protein